MYCVIICHITPAALNRAISRLLAVINIIALACASIGSRGLLHTFTPVTRFLALKHKAVL